MFYSGQTCHYDIISGGIVDFEGTITLSTSFTGDIGRILGYQGGFSASGLFSAELGVIKSYNGAILGASIFFGELNKNISLGGAVEGSCLFSASVAISLSLQSELPTQTLFNAYINKRPPWVPEYELHSSEYLMEMKSKYILPTQSVYKRHDKTDYNADKF